MCARPRVLSRTQLNCEIRERERARKLLSTCIDIVFTINSSALLLVGSSGLKYTHLAALDLVRKFWLHLCCGFSNQFEFETTRRKETFTFKKVSYRVRERKQFKWHTFFFFFCFEVMLTNFLLQKLFQGSVA